MPPLASLSTLDPMAGARRVLVRCGRARCWSLATAVVYRIILITYYYPTSGQLNISNARAGGRARAKTANSGLVVACMDRARRVTM